MITGIWSRFLCQNSDTTETVAIATAITTIPTSTPDTHRLDFMLEIPNMAARDIGEYCVSGDTTRNIEAVQQHQTSFDKNDAGRSVEERK